MTISAVATRYAHAFADVVTTPAAPLAAADAVRELNSFAGVLAGSLVLRNALATPAVPPGRKKAVVGRIAADLNLSRITRNFLFVLVDHRRIASLPEIAHRFELVLDERLGFARAEVASARELGEPLRSALGSELERVTGKRIRALFSVDPSLIGGVTARIGSTVYDGSVRGRLLAIGRRLASES